MFVVLKAADYKLKTFLLKDSKTKVGGDRGNSYLSWLSRLPRLPQDSSLRNVKSPPYPQGLFVSVGTPTGRPQSKDIVIQGDEERETSFEVMQQPPGLLFQERPRHALVSEKNS